MEGKDFVFETVFSSPEKLEFLQKARDAFFLDRAYVYDNSVDNQLPRLLYRTVDGSLFKQYTNDIPDWAAMLLKQQE